MSAETEMMKKANRKFLDDPEFREKVDKVATIVLRNTRNRSPITVTREAVALAIVMEEEKKWFE